MEQKIEQTHITYPFIHSGADKTDVFFYKGIVDLSRAYSADCAERRVFVTDETIAALDSCKAFFESFGIKNAKRGDVKRKDGDTVVILGAGEKFKTIQSVLFIVQAALDADCPRNTTFVGIGGGVITDMTAFAASIFKRGAKCEFVPTTLLAMVDAAVGGKSGCDFDNYKNMIGSFFPAKKLHVFPSFTHSLAQKEWKSGLAETIKTALLYSPALFEKLASKPDILKNRTDPLVFEAIFECVKAKGAVVERDFTEKNERMFLNLGHTFAHALETCAGLGEVTHGEAVAWGIARAAALSSHLNIAEEHYESRVRTVLLDFGYEIEKRHSSLPKSISPRDLFLAMKKDKKNLSNGVRFVLQKKIGETIVREVDEADVLSVL